MSPSIVAYIRGGLAVGLVGAGLLLLAGCPQSSDLTVNSAPPPDAAHVPSSASPATRSAVPIPPANFLKAVARLPDLVKTVMANTKIPGVAVAVVHDGKTVFAQGFGVREAGKPEPVTPDTVFQIASFSKSITATVVAKVISDCAQKNSGCNEVNWNMEVHPYLPYFSLPDMDFESEAI